MPRGPSLHWVAGCFFFFFLPLSNTPLPHPHTHPSSPPPGTYLSVAFIHNPCDLNLFPPHRPRLFLSLLRLKNFMLSSLCSFFFFHFTLLLFLYLPVFLLSICSNQLKDSSICTCKKKRGEGEERVSIKWNEIWQNTEGKKNNKSGIMAATREGEERQRICQQCCENCCVFHCLYHANQFLHFFFPKQTMRGDSTVRISLRSQRVWQCFGSATNLTALITNTVTLPSNWEIHFVSSHKMCCIDSASGRHSFFYSTCSLFPKWQAQIARQNTGVSLSTAEPCLKKNKNGPRVEFWNNAEETERIKKSHQLNWVWDIAYQWLYQRSVWVQLCLC